MFLKTPMAIDGYLNTNSEEVIRIIVGDSREAMREGLRQMLNGSENIKVIGEARNGREVLHQIKDLNPDIVILDGKMRGVDCIQIISDIKELSLNIDIIVLNDDSNHVVSAIESGVAGFLARDISRNELITVIRIIHLWRLVLFRNGTHFTLVKI
jgi:DNA-binding NarL/FixJ family response regulator